MEFFRHYLKIHLDFPNMSGLFHKRQWLHFTSQIWAPAVNVSNCKEVQLGWVTAADRCSTRPKGCLPSPFQPVLVLPVPGCSAVHTLWLARWPPATSCPGKPGHVTSRSKPVSTNQMAGTVLPSQSTAFLAKPESLHPIFSFPSIKTTTDPDLRGEERLAYYLLNGNSHLGQTVVFFLQKSSQCFDRDV